MKYLITIGIGFMLITGCSMKNSSVKKGATYGAIVGVSAVVLGAATDERAYNYVPIYLIGAVLWATIGATIGGTVGYAFSPSDEKKIQEDISSQNLNSGLVQ